MTVSTRRSPMDNVQKWGLALSAAAGLMLAAKAADLGGVKSKDITEPVAATIQHVVKFARLDR